MVVPVWPINLVDTPLGLIDTIDPGFLLQHNTRVILVEGRRTALRDFPGNRKTGVIDTVASIHLKSGLVRLNVQPVCISSTNRDDTLSTQKDSPDTRVSTPKGEDGAV